MFRSSEFVDYLRDWKDLRNFDTRILCSDGECRVHRLVLCHVSPFMGSLLDDQFPGEETVYSIPDVCKETMDFLLELAYTGSVRMNKSNFDLLEDAMRFLGWIRVDKCEVILIPDVEGNAKGSDSELKLQNRDVGVVRVDECGTKGKSEDASEVDRLKDDGGEQEVGKSSGGSEAEAKAVMEDILLQIEQSDQRDEVGQAEVERLGADNRKSHKSKETAGVSGDKMDVEETRVESPKKHLPDPGNVEVIDVESESNSRDVYLAPPECEIIKECKGLSQDGKRVTRKRKSSGLNAGGVDQVSPIKDKAGVSNKRRSNRIARKEEAATKNMTPDVEQDPIPPSAESEIIPCPSSQEDVSVAESVNGTESRSRKAATPSTPSKRESFSRRLMSSFTKTRPVALEEETLNTNGGSNTDRVDISPLRKRSARRRDGSTFSSPDKVNSASLYNYSDSESSSSSIKPRARRGKITSSDWQKLIVCSVCKSSATPSQTEACLLTHDFRRCWTCLDAIPSEEFESHAKNIHKEKPNLEKMPCKWCGAEGNNSWLGLHVVRHSPSQKFS